MPDATDSFLIARNPDPDSTLPYLLHVPIGPDELLFRTRARGHGPARCTATRSR